MEAANVGGVIYASYSCIVALDFHLSYINIHDGKEINETTHTHGTHINT